MEKEDHKKKEMLDSVYFNNKVHGEDNALRHILKAMSVVDRKYFVRKEEAFKAYEDFPLPIGYGQTISQPSTVARMLLLSDIKKGMNILDIGSGSGWNACLLAYLAYPGKVISVEILPELSDFAINNFNRLKIQGFVKSMNIEFLKGSVFSHEDLMKEKFDLIIAAAGADPLLIEKLKEFDFKRLVVPTSSGDMEVWKKKGKKISLELREKGYAFVPLIR